MTTAPEPIKAQLRDFIVENFLFGDASQAPEDSASLIETDIVDSTGILEMVAFLEERFGLSIDDAEIVPENFDTVERLAAFVAAKAPAASKKTG